MVPVQNSDEMVCIQCQEKMKAKSSTASRHIGQKHPIMASCSHEKKKRLVHLYESQIKKNNRPSYNQHSILIN